MTCSSETSGDNTVLFLFAHNDDEFFVLPRLEREAAAGHSVVCVYTTDGAAYGESPQRRLAESQAVLERRGVGAESLFPLGFQLGVRDGTSFRHLDSLWSELLSVANGRKISRIYVPAWEGGHADHDAAHLLAVALARVCSADVFEFSLYHSHRALGPLFRCMSLIPLEGATSSEDVSFRQALSWVLESRRYRSQRRAFLGLLPFCIPQILLRRSLHLRQVSGRNYRRRPYEGTLFYETRFKVPYDEFRQSTLAFIDRSVDPQSEARS